jgi:uncharacterized LabA/DUF88 family protein
MSNRSIIYIDGFNLYYGAIRGTHDKWLNIQRMFERLRPHDDIQVIRYFTALVDGDKAARQRVYLQAIETCPKVQIVLGKFKNKQIKCGVAECPHAGPRTFTKPEEKRTDVGIAIGLLDDAYQDRADRFVVVSGDSDLVPALAMLKRRFPVKELVVYVPSRNPIRGAAVELRSAADKDRTLPLGLIKLSQFPATLPDGHGGTIHKPVGW